MRVVFMGTPEFAVPCLKQILEDGYEIAGVFTQPDKPKGRKYVLTPPPVKEYAQSKGLQVFQPTTLKDNSALELLESLRPDVIVVVAYGKLLPAGILKLPPLGCINVHASLLPKYRGAAPIQWAVIRGEKVTGVTTMYMDEGLDTGDMIDKASLEIGENETAGELHDRLSLLGAGLLSQTLKKLQDGTTVRTPQKEEEHTYAPMLDKSLSDISWNKSAQEVHNQVRGLSPWPGASTLLDGKRLKIHQTRLAGMVGGRPGEVVGLTPLVIACGDGRGLELLEIQYEGSKRMAAGAFLLGHPIPFGVILGTEKEE